jgi:hypothetical protein
MKENTMNVTDDYRKKFLFELYNQLWNSNNVRLNLIWASIGTLISSFAIFALIEKNVISPDIATTLIILISGWLLAHTIDMSFWYNRNLAIIRNIEKQFLDANDAKEILPYFSSHPNKNKMANHLKIQSWLGIGIWLLVIIFHFIKIVRPAYLSGTLFSSYEIFIPYVFLIIIIVFLLIFQYKSNKEYDEFILAAPGKDPTA